MVDLKGDLRALWDCFISRVEVVPGLEDISTWG